MDENIKNLAKTSTIIHQRYNTFFTTTINHVYTEEEDLLVTIDVSSLYTNIIHEEGLQAMQDWMLQNNISFKRTEFIKKLGNLVLKHNYFEFNGQLFSPTTRHHDGNQNGPKLLP